MTVSSPLRSRGDPSASWSPRPLVPLRLPAAAVAQAADKRSRPKSLSRREAKARQRRGEEGRESEANSSPGAAPAPAATVVVTAGPGTASTGMDFSRFGFPSREWEGFVAQNPAAIIVPPIPSSIEELKRDANAARIDRGRAHIAKEGLADKFTTRDYPVPTRDGGPVTMRAYRPAGVPDTLLLPALVWFHGGGFLFGSLDGETYVCGLLCHRLQCAVLHICYRHTPEYAHPTAHHDAHDGFDFVFAHARDLSVDRSRLIVGGISSGGQLAASVTYREVLSARARAATGGVTGNGLQQHQHQRPRIRGQVLSVPWLCHRDAYPYHLFRDRSRASTRQCLWAPVTPKPRADLFTDLLRVEDVHGRLANLAQASDDELAGTVRTALISAGMDVKRDEGLLYALKLKSVGAQTKVHIFPGLPHAFYMFPDLPSRLQYHETAVECARWAFGDEPGQKEWCIEPPPAQFAG